MAAQFLVYGLLFSLSLQLSLCDICHIIEMLMGHSWLFQPFVMHQQLLLLSNYIIVKGCYFSNPIGWFLFTCCTDVVTVHPRYLSTHPTPPHPTPLHPTSPFLTTHPPPIPLVHLCYAGLKAVHSKNHLKCLKCSYSKQPV